MQIACTTTRAAADVLSILLSDGLRPGGAFRVTESWPSSSRFTSPSARRPAHLVKKLLAIPGTTIVEEDAT